MMVEAAQSWINVPSYADTGFDDLGITELLKVSVITLWSFFGLGLKGSGLGLEG
jgi:hypothetical protein